jgi:hypothetical protein
MSDGSDATHLDEAVRPDLLLSDERRIARIATAGSATAAPAMRLRRWTASCGPSAASGRTIF